MSLQPCRHGTALHSGSGSDRAVGGAVGGLPAGCRRNRVRRRVLGEALAAAGLCSRDELTAALSQQSSELTYEVLRWSFGRFSFSREAPSPEADAAKLGLGVSGLVLEGFRRVDELRLMETTVHFDQIVMLDPPVLESVGPAELSRGEQMILSAVDGTRTIAEVIRESCVGSFEAVKILYQFLQSRVLRTRAA